MTLQPTAVWTPAQQGAVQHRRKVQGISALIHGNAKAGKSSLADSGPVPRLIVDIEGTSFWTPSRKVYWSPMAEPVPYYDGTWDTCVVLAQDAATIHQTYKVLRSGQHPFKSASVDSITEFQQRIIDELVGWKKVGRDEWGVLLRQVSWATRQWRDLVTHPTAPLWTLTFVAGTHWDSQLGKWRPLVQGQVGNFLPYYVDLLGHLGAFPDESRWLLIGPHPQFETGERVGGRLPYQMPIAYPGRDGYSMESMLAQVLAGRY
jgi:AAA domain